MVFQPPLEILFVKGLGHQPPLEILFVRGVGSPAALTFMVFLRAADNTSRAYKCICKGGWGTRPYKCFICKCEAGGEAGPTALIEGS